MCRHTQEWVWSTAHHISRPQTLEERREDIARGHVGLELGLGLGLELGLGLGLELGARARTRSRARARARYLTCISLYPLQQLLYQAPSW